MSDSLVLIQGDHDNDTLRTWLNVSQFKSCVIHIQKLEDVSTAGGKLEFIPYPLPLDLDPKDISTAAIIDSSTGQVARVYGFQKPFEGLFRYGDGYGVCPRGWCITAQQSPAYEADCDLLMNDPCALAKELWCCYIKLTKDNQIVSISFRDMQKRYDPKSREDRQDLKAEYLEAKAECDRKCGARSTFRGGSLGHSCAHTIDWC